MSKISESSYSVIIIEDNVLIAQEVLELLEPAGFQPIGQFQTYLSALKSLDDLSPSFCVLDLDLGGSMYSGFGPGEEGRRLLAVLAHIQVPTVVYSAFTRMQHQLERIHPNMIAVDKIEPAERVIEALGELRDANHQA